MNILIFGKNRAMSHREIENIILDYLKNHDPLRIGVFDSYARNEQNIDSDIDLLVKFKNVPSLLQLIKIENDLREKLGIRVDLITEGAIKNRRIKAQIKQDLKIIYHA
ncbi:MAG: nucleotidyltransferase domain-containing protein [Bacteroidia bacterium]|nr:nucleotidyltransferase domain-containing protein [Bacteroidia bacterium]